MLWGQSQSFRLHSAIAAVTRALAYVAPLGWQHVNLTGEYLLGCRHRSRSRWVQAAAKHERQRAPGVRRLIIFTLRATNRTIPADLWRDPVTLSIPKTGIAVTWQFRIRVAALLR
jgi:hypothetical protein